MSAYTFNAGLLVGRRRRGHVEISPLWRLGDVSNELVLAEVVEELGDVGCDYVAGVEGVFGPEEDLVGGAPGDDHGPDGGTDAVGAEIKALVEVDDDDFSLDGLVDHGRPGDA